MEKVWREVEATEPDAAPAAHFACALAIAWPNDGQAETFDGRVDGTLVWPPRGDRGFGYDPMFVPVGHERDVRRARSRGKARDEPSRRRLPQARGGAEGMSGEPLALYVHWPFCVSKCPYCDFNSHVRASIDQDGWREALLADLAHEARLLPGRRLSSIFFGGGTPSLMDPRIVEAVITAAADHWSPADDIEITLEANPNSVEAARFADLARGRRQPPVPRPAKLRRRGASLPWTRAFGPRGFWRARNRAEAISPGQLRPHLRAPRRYGGALVGDAGPGVVARHQAPLALPTDDRAGHALRRAPRGGQIRAARRRSIRIALRSDRFDDFGGGHAEL